VRDGVDGFVIPIRDPEAIGERLLRLGRDRELLAAMSDSAVARAAGFTVNEYGRRLLETVGARSENEKMLSVSHGDHS
jgi:glycosyltransferase involved in cell wall biosynthesis